MAMTELQRADRAAELLSKSIGLADLLQAAGEQDANVTSATLTATCWALRDMLQEARILMLAPAIEREG
ncbi:MAG: hypothetical protein QM601_06325 [Pseudoxanthomonas sp.]